MQKSADSEALAWFALFPLQEKEERGRQQRAEQTEEKKKTHTRPVMQKHRFNVRLGSLL